jgi:cytidine deaminase
MAKQPPQSQQTPRNSNKAAAEPQGSRPSTATPSRPLEPAAEGAAQRDLIDITTSQPLPAELRELALRARAARAQAYAPYSRFQVGAAVRDGEGRIFVGANIENASYGLAVCAERTAILAAVLAGAREVTQVAVCTSLWPPAAPCGMCRQTLAEFAHDAEVVLVSPSGPAQRTRLSVLLPQAFRPRDLEAFAAQSEGKPPSWTGTRRT